MLKVNSKFWTKQLFVFFVLLLSAIVSIAQPWMPGYHFRKKITIDKSKVFGSISLLNFPVLIVLQDVGLKYISSCEGKIKHSKGLDISFATAGAPELPIAFQLDHYDPINGKLFCWVKINELFAGNNAGNNEIYFYYGATDTHDPFSLSAKAVWSDNYQQVWHMNLDILPAENRSANRDMDWNLRGTATMTQDNFSAGRIGNGISFNGSTDAMRTTADTNTTVCISAWIKLRQLGNEQVILASDTTTGGYIIKIDALGKLVFESKYTDGFKSSSTFDALLANNWYHITCIFINGVKRIYVNGLYKIGGGSNGIKMGRGGALSIGQSKQNDRYFNGWIDELSIQSVERNMEWISTSYRNQDNPEGFISVAAEEVNPANIPVVQEFTGAAGTEDWTNTANWSLGVVPAPDSEITIKADKRVRLSAPMLTRIGKLTLEPGAILQLESDLEVNCVVSVAVTAAIIPAEEARLILKYDLVNHGSIGLQADKGCLVFNGDHVLQTVSGMGTIKVARLELDLATVTRTLLLQSKINIGRKVLLSRGTLNSNGNLHLLTDTLGQTAALMPVQNPGNVQIIGYVNVQHFIEGDFISPATARGWRLLTSPVFQAEEQVQYDFSALKSIVFVTGNGGIANGFDVSPNNGATIYTHDQSFAGSLSQKYKAIPNMNTSVPLGKGFYLFSRGSRNVSDAYLHQIQMPPFSNPGPYVITYVGKLHVGNLNLSLSNRNTGAEGDGFNLLGNPYAASVRWGSLHKINVSPFIWMFNAKNNAYQVSDDPDYIIPSGTGFFVRVDQGVTSGSLIFDEAAKYTGPTLPVTPMLIAAAPAITKSTPLSRLKIELTRDGLYDDYTLLLRKGGNDGTDNSDAGKIGEGYLGIAGMATNGEKLAIDERAIDTLQKKIELYVKGWTSGKYTLNLKPAVGANQEVILEDHYLGVNKRLTDYVTSSYSFFMDSSIPATHGTKRFTILYKQIALPKATVPETDKNIQVYPNPFQEVLYLKSSGLSYRNLKVLIRDVMGKVVWQSDLPALDAGIPVRQLCGKLVKGIYFLQLTEQNNRKVQAVFKIVKN